MSPENSLHIETYILIPGGVARALWDAAGDLLYDGNRTYQYDAEGRVISSVNTSGSNWQDPMYNALGQRIGEHQAAGSNDSTYLYYPRDIFGHRTEMFEYHPSAGWAGACGWYGQIAGQRLEMGGGNSWLAHVDAVGSMVMETKQTGAVTWDMGYYPWGQLWYTAGPRASVLFAGLGMTKRLDRPLTRSLARSPSP